MAWELSSWLALSRSFQLFGAFASAAMNGFLIAMIYSKHLGLAQNMVVLELLICILLVYTTLAITVQHSGKRSKSTSWLTFFVVADVCFTAVTISIITVLARAGLPSHCAGLTSDKYDPDAPMPDQGYTSVRFSNESGGQKGELDKFCAFERSYYFIAIGLIFLFIVTIVLTILRICEKYYVKKTNELLDALQRARDADEKANELLSPSSPALHLAPKLPPSPPSEGIITRHSSVRSAYTSTTGITGISSASPYAQRLGDSYQNPHNHAAPAVPPRRLSIPPSIPRRPVPRMGTGSSSAASGSSSSLISGSGQGSGSPGSNPTAGYTPLTALTPLTSPGFVQVSLSGNSGPGSSSFSGARYDEDDDDAAAALVTDGMQHQGHPHLSHMQQGHLHHQQQHRSHQLRELAAQRMPMLLEDREEQTAEGALISDGMRGTEHVLPPYEPGEARMLGHGGEDNEMRLSEYVKGQTRAQDMKDSGRY